MYGLDLTYAMCAADPVITAPATIESMIGDTMTYTFDYTNNGATWFGPYIDIRLPAWLDGDDWLRFNTASYLGTPLVNQVLVASWWFVDHPYAMTATWAQQIFINTWEQYLVLQLPFGSFTNGQSAEVSLSVDISPFADAWQPLNITMQWWFQYGCDASDNPSVDPSDTWSPFVSSISPWVFTINKSYNWPEFETATGPNFPRTHTITADIAKDQTINAMTLVDELPLNAQYLGVVSSSPAWTIIQQPSTTWPVTAGDRRVVIDFANVVWSSAPVDVSMEVQYFFPQFDALSGDIIDATTWDETQ